MFLDAKHTKILLTLNSSQIQLHRHSIKQAVWPPDSADMVCPCPSVTLTYDCLTLKLVCELHLRWGTFTPKLHAIYPTAACSSDTADMSTNPKDDSLPCRLQAFAANKTTIGRKYFPAPSK